MIDEELTCEVCGEGEGPYEDVVAEWWDGRESRLAHELCVPRVGRDERAWTLA